ncbi:WD40-repeat-containing domain protein [Trametes gibbosa]|nr:WD40-repeat-containing domain protein [Trametes gibbosa]
MAHFPYTRLIVGDRKALAVSGHHFHIINVHSGEIIHSTTKLSDQAQEGLEKSGAIRCAAVDPQFAHIITTADDKRLKVWQVGKDFTLLSERELPKKPTEIGFTRDGQTVVVSDKFGDVFSYPLHPDPTPEPSTSQNDAPKRGSLTAHENPSDGTLILGHASMLTTFLLTVDDQYIITADRDEHIRISWFPKGYVIERYCLGHEKFVSALHIPPFHPSTLVSGGGDPMLKVWDWMSGELLAEIAVFDAVEHHVRVKAPKRRHGGNDGDVEGEVGSSDARVKSRGSKGRRRGKGKKGAEGSLEVESPADEASQDQAGKLAARGGDIPMTETNTPGPSDNDIQPALGANDDSQLVFAVHKIQSVDRGEHGRFVLFTAVGAAAVFYAPFPANGEKLPASAVRTLTFGRPVIDFTVSQEGQVWVLLDPNWESTPDAPPSDSAAPVRLLSWQDGTLAEAPGTPPPLAAALTSNCPVPATAAQLKGLDLYAALSALPKNVDPEHDAVVRDTLSEAAAAASVDGAGVDGKPLTQRELGRLRKKQALLAKIQEQAQARHASREGTADAADAERETKRARSESAGDGPVVGEDAAARDSLDVDMEVP